MQFSMQLYVHRFRQKYPVSRGKIREWCRGILECLAYLHSEVPASEGVEHRAPIIHRDLKCDNIFVSSASKSVKVGDLGLATTDGRSAMGTPEFMAPDVFDGNYTTSVDIHSFGMCVLEMVTGASPYGECDSFAQISNRVLSGQMPDSLKALKVAWPEAHRFVCLCLKGVEDEGEDSADAVAASGPRTRPAAADLLKHPLLVDSATDNSIDTEEMLAMVHAAGIQIPVAGGGFLQLKPGAPSQSATGKGPLSEATEHDPSAPAVTTPRPTTPESVTSIAAASTAGTETGAAPSKQEQSAKASAQLQRSSSAASNATDGSGIAFGRQLSVEGTPGLLWGQATKDEAASGGSVPSGNPGTDLAAPAVEDAPPAAQDGTQQGVPHTIPEDEHDSDGEDGPVGLHEDADTQSSAAETVEGAIAGSSDVQSTVSAPAAPETVAVRNLAAEPSAAEVDHISPASAPVTPAGKRETQQQSAAHVTHSTPAPRTRSVPNSGAVTPGVASISRGTPVARSSSADTGGTDDVPLSTLAPTQSAGSPSSSKAPLSPGVGAPGGTRPTSMPRAASRTTVEFHQEVDIVPLGSPPVASAGTASGQLSAPPSSPGKGSFAPSFTASGNSAGGAGGTGMTNTHSSSPVPVSAGSGGTGTGTLPEPAATVKSARSALQPAPVVAGGSNLRRMSAHPHKAGQSSGAVLHRLQTDVLDLRRDMDSVLDSVTELNSMMRFLVSNQQNGREALAAMDDTKQQRLQNRAAAQRMSSAAAAASNGLSRHSPAAPSQTIPGADGSGETGGRRVRASSIGSATSNLSLPPAQATADTAGGRAPPHPVSGRSSLAISSREAQPGGGAAGRPAFGSSTPPTPSERVLNLQDDGSHGANKFVAQSIHSISCHLTKDERSAGSILAARFDMQPDQLLVDTPTASAEGAQGFVEKRTLLLERFEREVGEEFAKVRKKLESLDNTLSDNLQQAQVHIETENKKHRKEAQVMKESRQKLSAESAEQELAAGDAALEGEAKKSSVRAQNTRKANMDRKQKLQTEREEHEQKRHAARLGMLEAERSRRQRVALEKRKVLVDGRAMQVGSLAEALQLHVQGLVRETTGMMDPAEQAEAMAQAAAARPASQPAPGANQSISASPIALNSARQSATSLPVTSFGAAPLHPDAARLPLVRESSGGPDVQAFAGRNLTAGSVSDGNLASLAPGPSIGMVGQRPGSGGVSGFSSVGSSNGGQGGRLPNRFSEIQ